MTSEITPKSITNSDYKPWLVSGILLFFDILSLTLSFEISIKIRESLIPNLGGEVILQTIIPIFFMSFVLIIFLFAINDFYPGSRRIGIIELKEIFKIVSFSYIILGLAIYIFDYGNRFSRTVFFISWFSTTVLISGFRLIVHNRGSLLSWWGEPVLIVGYKKDVQKVIHLLTRARRMALKPVVALIYDKSQNPTIIDGIPYFPFSSYLQNKIRESGISQVLFVNNLSDLNAIAKKRLFLLSLSFSKVIYVLGESPISTLLMKPLDIEGRPALRIKYNLLNPWSLRIKRFTELLICFIIFVIFFIPLLLIALIIKLDSPGPLFFTQKRVGISGHLFDIYKFRTMRIGSETELQDLLKKNIDLSLEYQEYHKLKNDPRITRVGRFLRKTSLDEIPQLFNIFRGDMSLVGPRAYLPEETNQIGDSIFLINRVRPGLTGWWQVMGRNNLSFQERILLDEYYISNFSLWMDFYVIFKTFWIILSGHGE